MRPTKMQASLAGAVVLTLLVACSGPRARSPHSFDQIQRTIEGKSAAEVLHLLGEPDSRQAVFDGDERWIWWNYTFLDGSDYAPEMRGRVVHLEIVFQNPVRGPGKASPAGNHPYRDWRVDDSLGVQYQMPSADR